MPAKYARNDVRVSMCGNVVMSIQEIMWLVCVLDFLVV